MDKKYIVTLADEYALVHKLTVPVTINGKHTAWMQTDINLTPYTEPDLEQVRIEAYEKGYHAGYGKYINKSYEDGLKDAWEAARKIWKYDTTTLRAIFGEGIMRMDWFMNFTASEAIEKLQAYEQEQDEKKKTDYYFEMMKDAIETSAKEYGMSLDEVAAVLESLRRGSARKVI